MAQISKEADAKELVQVIYALGQGEDPENVFLVPREIQKCLRVLPSAIGWWLKNSQPLEDGSYRGEMHGGLIIHAVPREAREGDAFGVPFKEGAHFDIFVKFEAEALRALSEQLGMPVKNA